MRFKPSRRWTTLICFATVPLLAGWAALDILPEDRQLTEAYAKDREWPAGTVELVNDELRMAGWDFFFSECANDVLSYGFRCENASQANHLIELLARIESSARTVLLSPEAGGRPPLGQGRRQFTATFSIGSQKHINRWYEGLETAEGSTTVRVWGVHRFEKPPVAMGPTLTIYLGTEEIDPRQLRFPARITVRADIRESYRESFPDDAQIALIEQLAARHARPRTSTQPTSAPATAPSASPSP